MTLRRHQVTCMATIALAACLVRCGPGTPKAGTVFGGPIPRADGAAAAVNGRVYYIGGLTDGGESTAIEVYDHQQGRWLSKKPMPTARAAMYAVVANGQIYVIGGRKENAILEAVERYDPVTDSWSQCAPMTTARWRHIAAVFKGKIYVFGGIAGTGDARRVLSTVEVYDPTADSWFQATPMSAGKSGAAAAVLDDKIYLAGGKLGAGAGAPATERVDVYDPDLDRWALGRPLPTRRVSGCAAVIADRLYVLGGGTAGGLTKPVEVYEVKTDTWRSGAPLSLWSETTTVAHRSAIPCMWWGERTRLMGRPSSPRQRPTGHSLLLNERGENSLGTRAA